MLYQQLGNSGLLVSRLCMGVLTISPIQNNLSLEDGAGVLAYAMHRGINFFDTAKIYRTYPYIKKAIADTGMRPVITSKSYDYSYKGMKDSVEEALDEMGISYIDIFMLHEQESINTLRGHRDALKYLVDAKEKGYVKAIGLSTHSVKGVLGGVQTPEIQVIHPLINRRGLGIMDGSAEQMLAAIHYAHFRGKGIYAMKALGGGNLISDAYRSFQFVASNKFIHSMAVGMKSRDEIDANIAWMDGIRKGAVEQRISKIPRRLHIDDWCQGCGRCVEHCRYQALKVVNGKAQVDNDKCLLCGYCANYCQDFCIKIV